MRIFLPLCIISSHTHIDFGLPCTLIRRCLLCRPLPPKANDRAQISALAANDRAQIAEGQQLPPVHQEGGTSVVDGVGEGYIVDARMETDEDRDKDVVGEVVIGDSKEAIAGPYQLQSIRVVAPNDGAEKKEKPAKKKGQQMKKTDNLSYRHRQKESGSSQPSFASAIAAEACEEEAGKSNVSSCGKWKRGEPKSSRSVRNTFGGDKDNDVQDDDKEPEDRESATRSSSEGDSVTENRPEPSKKSTEAGTAAVVCKEKRKQKRKKRDDGPFVADGHSGMKDKYRRSKQQAKPESSTTVKRKQKKGKISASSAVEEELKNAIADLSKEKKPANKVGVRSLKILLRQCKIAGSPEDEARVTQLIVKLGGTEAVLGTIQVFPGSSEVLTLACEVLQYICYYDNAVVARHNVLHSIRMALCDRPADVRVVQSSIGALQTCVGATSEIDREIVNGIINGGCLDQVVRAMEEHGDVPEIQLNACLFLQDLAAECDQGGITNVLRSGALDSVIRAIKHTQKSDIILAGLAAIGNMPQEELVDPRASLQTFESLKSFLHSSMNTAAGDPAVVAKCCGLLNNLSVETSTINSAIIEAGFIKKTTDAMEAFDNEEDVQCSGCMLLRSLAHGKNGGRSNEVVRDGGLERISYCLSAFSDNATVLAAALGALRNIRHPEDHSCSAVGTVDKIFKVMDNHRAEQDIQEDCCELLWQYTAFPSVPGKIKEMETLLTDAADTFPESCGPIVANILPMLVEPKDNSFTV